MTTVLILLQFHQILHICRYVFLYYYFLTTKNTFEVLIALFSQYASHKSGKTDCTLLCLWSSGLKILPGTGSASPSEYYMCVNNKETDSRESKLAVMDVLYSHISSQICFVDKKYGDSDYCAHFDIVCNLSRLKGFQQSRKCQLKLDLSLES